jgi:hypothetical protein
MYKRRKKATASFPPKASPQRIRDAMYKYEQIIEDACAAVETSCASCGTFLAKTASSLVPIDDGRLRPFKSSQGVLQLDTCSIVDSCYRFC